MHSTARRLLICPQPPRLSDPVETVCEDWLLAREQELQPNTERAYRDLEASGYSRSTLRTLDLVSAKALAAQTGRTLGAHKPWVSDEVRPVWILAEARRFLEHVRGHRLYPLWRLLLTTGLRCGELCGLMWRDLEPEQGSLKVCRQRIVEDPASQVR